MFKVGVVGCGGIGMTHARTWNSLEGVQVSAVVDTNLEKAKAAAEACKCPCFSSVDELPEDLDAVSVVTPPASHFAIAKRLLERGFHVFCEKPLTMDVAEGELLEALAKRQKKELGVGFKMRFEPIFVEAKKHLPEIGTLRSIVTTKQQAFNPRPEGAWVKKVGAMYELSIHDFDLISFITVSFLKRCWERSFVICVAGKRRTPLWRWSNISRVLQRPCRACIARKPRFVSGI